MILFANLCLQMHEQDNVRDILHQAFQVLNSEADRSHYFDLHDDSLVTHGLPGNFSSDKEGMMKLYSEVWSAFPDAILILIVLLLKEAKQHVCSR